jgi:hypothetical protein
MGKASKREKSPRLPWSRRLLITACLVLPLALGTVIWWKDGARHGQRIGWDAVHLVQPSPMPTADFLRELRVAGGWNSFLDLGDPDFLEKLNAVCSRHDWVERVNYLGLGPNGQLSVDLLFRKPIARIKRGGQPYVVDHQGKWLMPFPNVPIDDLVELVGWESLWPLDQRSTDWLKAAALLAEVIQSDKSAWNIESIVLVRQPVLSPDLRLQTRQKQQIIWQSLDESGDREPSPTEKLSRLRIYFDRFRQIPEGQVLDVRPTDGIIRFKTSP